MKRAFVPFFVLAVFFLVRTPAFAADHLVINLEAPRAESPKNAAAKSFYIQSVADNRVFGEATSSPSVQSWGIMNWREQTDELKHRTVGRVYARKEDTEGHILISRGTVESVMKDAVTTALVRLGYSVVPSKEEMRPETIPVDVSIVNFWGYFSKSPIGGDINTLIEAVVTLNKKDKIEKKTIKIEDKEGALRPRKQANWEKVFSMAIGDFINTAMKELKQ